MYSIKLQLTRLIQLFLFILICSNGYSQGAVGIGTNDPDDSAILDVFSNNRGILIPRVDGNFRVPDPIAGLMIYNTQNSSYEYFDGSNWIQLISTPAKVDLNMDASSINMSDNRISNLAAGAADGDAVNFRQMDDAVIPSGGIIMWSGATLPAGWVLCNGSNGTPDLRDQFILGASTVGTYGTGGAQSHTTSTVTYFEQNLYTTSPANCSPYRYLYSFTSLCDDDAVPASTYEQDFNDIAANSCAQAVSFANPGNCSILGTCTREDNPEYYIGNPACSTGATQRAVVTGLENQPQFYRLAFIMKL